MGRNSRRIDCEYTNDAIMTNDGLIIGLRTICESQNSFSGFIDSLRIHRCSRTALIEDTCVIKLSISPITSENQTRGKPI